MYGAVINRMAEAGAARALRGRLALSRVTQGCQRLC